MPWCRYALYCRHHAVTCPPGQCRFKCPLRFGVWVIIISLTVGNPPSWSLVQIPSVPTQQHLSALGTYSCADSKGCRWCRSGKVGGLRSIMATVCRPCMTKTTPASTESGPPADQRSLGPAPIAPFLFPSLRCAPRLAVLRGKRQRQVIGLIDARLPLVPSSPRPLVPSPNNPKLPRAR